MRICVLLLTIVVVACSGSSAKTDADGPYDATLEAVGDAIGDTDAGSPDVAADVSADVAVDVAADVPADVPADVHADVPADIPADAPSDVPTDLPAETAADTTPDTSTEGVGSWTQCSTDAECQAVLGQAGFCNPAFPGGQCQGCDPSDFLACQPLGHDGLTLTCREMAPTVCLFDCPCPPWLRCLESEQLCILKVCGGDAECEPFACRPISAGGASYCLPAL